MPGRISEAENQVSPETKSTLIDLERRFENTKKNDNKSEKKNEFVFDIANKNGVKFIENESEDILSEEEKNQTEKKGSCNRYSIPKLINTLSQA